MTSILILIVVIVLSVNQIKAKKVDSIKRYKTVSIVLIITNIYYAVTGFLSVRMFALFREYFLMYIFIIMATALSIEAYMLFDAYKKWSMKHSNPPLAICNCPDCDAKFSQSDKFCSYCGFELKEIKLANQKTHTPKKIDSVFYLLSLSIYIGIVILTFQNWIHINSLNLVNDALAFFGSTNEIDTSFNLFEISNHLGEINGMLNQLGISDNYYVRNIEFLSNLFYLGGAIIVVANALVIASILLMKFESRVIASISLFFTVVISVVFLWIISSFNEEVTNSTFEYISEALTVTYIPYLIIILSFVARLIIYPQIQKNENINKAKVMNEEKVVLVSERVNLSDLSIKDQMIEKDINNKVSIN